MIYRKKKLIPSLSKGLLLNKYNTMISSITLPQTLVFAHGLSYLPSPKNSQPLDDPSTQQNIQSFLSVRVF
jgi:hypothetical protein